MNISWNLSTSCLIRKNFNTDGEGNMFKAFMEVMMSSVIQQTEIGSYLQQNFFFPYVHN